MLDEVELPRFRSALLLVAFRATLVLGGPELVRSRRLQTGAGEVVEAVVAVAAADGDVAAVAGVAGS